MINHSLVYFLYSDALLEYDELLGNLCILVSGLMMCWRLLRQRICKSIFLKNGERIN